MARRARFALVAGVLAFLAAGLLLGPGVRVDSPPDGSAVSLGIETDPPPPGSAPSPRAPGEAPDLVETPTSRAVATAKPERARTERVHGRLVMKGGGPLPGEATVTILTGKPEIDAPESARELALSRENPTVREFLLSELGAWRPRGWKHVHRTAAAPDGAFAVSVPPDLPGFRFQVDADYAVYPASRERFSLDSAEVREGVVLTLEPAGRVEGRLAVPGGKPVRIGEVELASESRRPWSRPGAVSDGEGRFVIRGVPPGLYGAWAKAVGCASAIARDLEIRVGETTRADFDLPAESFVSGVVVDVSDKGVSGATIRANRREGGSASSMEAFFKGLDQGEAMTDASGSFRIGGLRGTSYAIGVRREGMLPTEDERVMEVPAGAGVGDLRFVLEEGRSLAGRVVDDLGRPVAQASVSALPDWRTPSGPETRRGSGAWQSTKSLTDGSFRLTGLLDRAQQVTASAEGYGHAEVRPVEPGRSDFEIVLLRCALVSGVVRAADSGEPITRFDVGIASFRDGPIGQRSSSSNGRSVEAPEGKFVLDKLEPLPNTFTFRARGFLPETVGRIELKSGEERTGLEVSLRRGAGVRGIVVEKGSRTPVAGAQVRDGAETLEPAMRFLLRSREEKQTGSDGAFDLEGLEPGTVQMQATRDSYAAGEASVEVRPGETVEGVVIELSRGGSIEGTYLDADGTARKAGRVFLTTEDGRERKETRIDAEGSFCFERLTPGRYQVRGSPPRRLRGPDRAGEAHVLVDVEEGRATRVELRPESRGRCTLRGRVLRGGEGLEHARVFVVPRSEAADDLKIALARGSISSTDADGSYAIEGVRPGEAELIVEINWGICSTSFPIHVPDATEFAFDARIPPGSIEGRVVRASDGGSVTAFVVRAIPFPWEAGRPRSWIPGANISGGDGRFRFTDLWPGTYFVSVVPSYDPRFGTDPPSDLAGETSGPIELRGDEPVFVNFSLREGGSARVSVVDGGGSPVSGAAVFVIPADARDEPHRLFLGNRATTDASGVARVDRVAGGLYVALVRTGLGTGFLSDPKPVRKGEETKFWVEVKR
jgi:carboxypeptidase family protein